MAVLVWSFAIVAPAAAEWSTPVRLAGDALTQRYQLEVASSGYAIAAWTRYVPRDDGFTDLELRAAIRPPGGEWGASRVIAVPRSDTFGVGIADNGEAVVAFIDARSAGGNAPYDVKVVTRSATGVWGTSSVVSGEGSAGDVTVAVNGAGRGIVGWRSSGDGTGSEVHAVTRASGGAWSEVQVLDSGSVVESVGVGIGGDGTSVVAWPDSTGAITATSHSPDTGWGEPVEIAQEMSRSDPPHVGVDDAGDATVMFAAHSATSGADVRVATRPAGGSWLSAVTLATETYGGQLAVGPQGHMTVAFSSARDGEGLRSRSRAPGGAWSPVQTLSAGASPGLFSVATDGQGKATAVWLEYDATAGHTRLLSSTRAPGATWQSPDEIDAAEPPLSYPVVDVDAHGHATTIWPDDKSDSNYSSTGSLNASETIERDYCLLPPSDGGPIDEEVPEDAVVTGPDEPTERARRVARSHGTGQKAILRFGVAEVVGCFSETAPGAFTNNSPGVRINGIDVAAPSKSLQIDTNAWTIESQDAEGHPVNVRFSIDGQKVWVGPLDKKFSSSEMAEAFSKSVEATAFKGLKLSGSLKLGMVPPTGDHLTGATQLTLVGQLPQTKSVKFGSAGVGALQFVARTENGSGLQPGTITGSLGALQIGKFGMRDLSFSYDFAKDAWTAVVNIALPFPLLPQVGGSVTVTKGRVTAFSVTAAKFNKLVGAGIFLQKIEIDGSTGDNGETFTVGGLGGLSVGPEVTMPDGTDVTAISGTGKVSYAFSNPGVWSLSTTLSMVNVPLADGLLKVSTAGKVDFEGRAHLHGEVGALKLFNAEGKVFGFADRDSVWQAQGAVHHVRFLKWSFGDDANAQALASSKGMAICAGKAGHRVGFTYDYRDYKAIRESCDVGKMAVVRGRLARQASTRAAAGDRATVTVGEGETLAVFAGKATGEAPKLTVSGPGGTAIATPEEGAAQTDTHLVGQDGEGRTYVVVFDPPAGTYEIESDRPLEEVAAADSTAGADAPPVPVLVEPAPEAGPGPDPQPQPGGPAPGVSGPVPPTALPVPPASAVTISQVAVKRVKLKAALRRGVSVTGVSSAPATLDVALSVTAKTARKLKLGRKRIVLARASQPVAVGRFTLRLKISRKVARKLKRARKLPMVLTGTASTPAGKRTSFTGRRTLRR